MSYNVANWYWNVDGSTTQVWSSARVQYVPLTDATYLAWVAQGNVATNIVSESELQAVFAAQYPGGWPPTVAQQAASAFTAGVQVTSTAAPTLAGTYAIDPGAQQRITSVQTRIASGLGLPMRQATISWPDIAGAGHNFTAAQFTQLAELVSDFVFQLDQAAAGLSATIPTQPVLLDQYATS